MGLSLTPHQLVIADGVELESVVMDDPVLVVPAESFCAGTTVSRQFHRIEQAGELSFILNQPYRNFKAVGVWVLAVLVNGDVLRRWKSGRGQGENFIRILNLNARDLVEIKITVIEDRIDMVTWEAASRCWVSEVEFNPTVHRGPTRLESSYVDPFFDDRICNGSGFSVSTIGDLSAWVRGNCFNDTISKVFVINERCIVPLLVVKRSGATRTVVLSNGAVDLHRTERNPVFQRSSFCHELYVNQIYVCDPGTVGPHALPLSWGILGFGDWCIPKVGDIVRLIADALNGSSGEPTTYFGSSAGGFWALALAHFDHGSRAIVNNAQFDWTRWMAGAVNELRASRLGNELPSELRRRLPHQTGVLRLLSTRPEALRVDYYVNTESKHDATVDLPQMEAFLKNYPRQSAAVEIHRYADENAGHNPMDMPHIIDILNAS
ncbi:hypothetical protein [Kocuria sp. ZOR0020]|uniref:hypothetical protein n=1 Tax=Kocuria sp. ZOR0020 TaxID=1339234 RepID=UPI000A5682A2|nr:hypothetical protein [Kocuria sp. ZOR0020]